MIAYFYDVDERDAMFFYRATPLDESKFSQYPLRVLCFSNYFRTTRGVRRCGVEVGRGTE